MKKTNIPKKQTRIISGIFIILCAFILTLIIFLIQKQEKSSLIVSDNLNNKVEKNLSNQSLNKTVVSKIEKTLTEEEKKVTAEPALPPSFCLHVPVLIYHHVEPFEQANKEGHANLTVDLTYFDSQMKYLRDHVYHAISAEELVSAIKNHSGLPVKSIVITVDDGYSDFYTYAYPIIKKYGITANLMIPSGLMENHGYMTWNNLREMLGSGLVKVYNHTWSHYPLPKGDNEKVKMEIITAKDQLEKYLGVKINILTYPYGSFDNRVVQILKTNGFTAAFSTIPSFYQCESYIYALRRNRIGNAPLSAYGL